MNATIHDLERCPPDEFPAVQDFTLQKKMALMEAHDNWLQG